MRLVSIASGSDGNCIYVGSDATHLLVDTGISMKRAVSGLNGIGIDMKMLDAILITHEHSDHIKSIGAIARKYEIPIYTTSGTARYIRNDQSVGEFNEDLIHTVSAEQPFILKDITVNPMKISHDAAEPVAYRFKSGGSRIAVVTDIGRYDDYIVESLKGMDLLFLEANHDVHMLQVGPYPYYLKQRILGDKGHLSNENSGRLLSRVLHDNVKAVMLGHLSKQNNYPDLAYETVKLEVTMGECPYDGNDFPIYVAKRGEPSQELVC